MPSTHTEMASSRKRQEDKNLKILRELVTQPHNKKCFDCGQRGPTYVNMTIGAFVCTSCSGLLRGLNPPHRIKSISMASFNQQEIEFLQKHGNQVCHYTWLALRNTPVENESREEQKMKDYLVYKYERKVWYSDQKPPPSVVSQPAEEQPPAAKPLKSLLGTSVNVFVSTEAPAQKPQTIISTAGLSTSSSFEAPKPRANNNMDLLSSNFASDPFASTAAPNNVIDPFAQASAQQSTPPLFDAFTSSDDSRNQDSFDLFVNAKPNASQATINNQANGAATPAMPIGNSNGSVDKYAALAELDMSNTQSVFSSSSIFGSSPATNNNPSGAQPAAPSAQPNPFMSPSVSSSGAAVFQQQQQKPVNPFMSAAPAAAAPSTNIFGSAAPAADPVPQTNNIFGNARWDLSNTSSSSSLDFNNVSAASNANTSYFPFGQSPATAAAATNNFMSMSTAAPTAAASQHANMFSSQSSSPFQNNMGFSTGQTANQKAFPQQVRPQQPQQQNQFQNQFQNQQPFSTQPQQQQQPQHPFGNPTQPFGNPTQPFGNPSQPFGNQTQPFGNPSQPFGNQFAQQPQQPFSSHQAQPFSSHPQQQQQQQQYNFSMDPNSSQSSQMFNSNFNSPFGSASTNQNQASSVFGAPANSTPFNQPVKSTNPFM